MPSEKSARRSVMRLVAALAVVLVPLGVTATIQAARVREAAPPAPAVAAAGATSVTATWPRNSRDLSYELSHRPAGTTTWVKVTGIISNQHTISNLQPGTQYDVRLRVRYSRTISAWSVAAKVTTAAATSGGGSGGSTRTPQPPNRIRWQGSEWYVSGVNVPWLTWPWAAGHGDFGGGAVDGVVARRDEVAAGFATLQASGTHMVRWWTFQQDAWQISRDANGWPTALNPAVYADFDAALQLAEKYDLYYNFVLFGGPSGFPSTWRTDPAQRTQLAKVLGPLFARYKDNPRVMAWEIFNEPEWEIWNNGTVVKEADVKAMANAIIYSIRSNAPNTLVTIGSALVGGFNSTQKATAMWTDVDLDFYSPHWYDTQFSPASVCALCTTVPDLQRLYGTTKPFVIGEYQQGSGTRTQNETRLQQWRDKGYAGAWGWSLFPQFTADGFPTDIAALTSFHAKHSDIGPRRSTTSTGTTVTTAPATTAPVTTAPATTAPATTAPATTAPATTVPPTTAPATTVPPTTAPATTAPTATVPPAVAVAPPGNRYSNQALVYNDGYKGHPSGDGTGNFRIVCYYSHMNYDDAIVFPGQPGKAHMHTYFGNTGSNASSTYDSLRNSGGGSCVGGTANRSSYWVPSLMDSSGQPIVPLRSFQYYKSGYRGVEPREVKRIPNGLRIIAGTSSSKTAQSEEIINWYCSSGGSGPVGAIPSCPAGSTLLLSVTFPQCWDGVNLDSADHKSHMTYPIYPSGCPASHPVSLPVLTLHAEWEVPSTGSLGWRLSSDNYPTTTRGGYSAHADFFEAWDPAIRNTFTDICVTGGIDCEVRYLGDGRYLADPPVVSGTTRSAVTRDSGVTPAAAPPQADSLFCNLENKLATAAAAGAS